MINNQRGSTLLTVLIINLVLIILGMSIISATISSSKRTAIRDSEISITYGAMDAVNAFTTKLVQELNNFGISGYFSDSKKNLYEPELEDVLKSTVESLLKDNKSTINKDLIKCINLIDVTGTTPEYVLTKSEKIDACLGGDSSPDNYKDKVLNLDTNNDLTRVYDLVITTTNPIETQGNVEKLVTKRLILSPLPSFLRYAVGSESLYLNGSSNIVGNVFAGKVVTNNKNSILAGISNKSPLELSNIAYFYDKDNKEHKTITNQYPSIVGNVYSTNSEILKVLESKNFYKNKIPNLLHDSQFTNINFDQTFLFSISKALAEFSISMEDNIKDLFNNFKNHVTTIITNNKGSIDLGPAGIENCIEEIDGDEKVIEGCYKTTPKVPTITEPISMDLKSLTIGDVDNELKVSGSIYIKGDLTIYAKQKLTITGPIYVDGNVTIVADSELNIGKDYNNFYVNGNLNIVASGNTTINSNILTTGSISATNFNTSLNMNGSVISGNEITISSITKDSNEGTTTIANQLDTTKSTMINKGLISAKDTKITSQNMLTIIKDNLFINGNFTISGNDELVGNPENDNVLFKSVIYVNGQTTISNTNISTINSKKDNLVLLSKDKLLLTRINEFRYYKNKDETTPYYLPKEDNEESINPIRGFFYTDSEAELYGVGSLFYVHGGIFAKDKLVINAVRGETSNETINHFSPAQEEGMLSRFIVKYDDSILFNSLTSLPIVEHLQLILDEQTVQ